MKKPVPKCQECTHCRKEPIVEGGSLHDLCHHPAVKGILPNFRWIKYTAKRNSSPKWCPLRGTKNKP